MPAPTTVMFTWRFYPALDSGLSTLGTPRVQSREPRARLEPELHPDLHLARALRHCRLSEVIGQQIAAESAIVHAVEDVVGGDEELHHVARIERSVALIAGAGAAASASAATLALRVEGLTDRCASATTRSAWPQPATARTARSATATWE